MSAATPSTPIEAPAPIANTTFAADAATQLLMRELDDDPTQIRDLFLKEVNCMIRYTMSAGQKIPAEVFAVAEAFGSEQQKREREMRLQGANYLFDRSAALDIAELSAAHDILSAAIAPATPRAIMLLDPVFTQKSRFNWLSTVPLLRRLMLVSSLSLLGFILIALSPDITPTGGNIFSQDGIPLLVNLSFFVFAAAMGATFSALFQANEYIVNGIFDPKFDTSYWIRLLVGIMAGLILASLIPIDPNALGGLGKPTLALLGGFSASLVHRILNLLVGAIEGVVKKMAGTMLDNPQENARKDVESKKSMEAMMQSKIDSALQKQDK